MQLSVLGYSVLQMGAALGPSISLGRSGPRLGFSLLGCGLETAQ